MKTTRYRFEQSVQEAKEDTKSWLTDEFKSILESDKDFTRKADYIGFSIASIDAKVVSLDEEIKELQTLKKNLKSAKTIALAVGAEVFASYGIDKLEGAGISSITINKPNPTSKVELTIHNEYNLIDAGFYKKVIDKESILEAYNSGSYLEVINANCTVEITRDVKEPKLKINKRRSSATTGTIATMEKLEEAS